MPAVSDKKTTILQWINNQLTDHLVVSEMTYTVSSGTLNSSIPYRSSGHHHFLSSNNMQNGDTGTGFPGLSWKMAVKQTLLLTYCLGCYDLMLFVWFSSSVLCYLRCVQMNVERVCCRKPSNDCLQTAASIFSVKWTNCSKFNHYWHSCLKVSKTSIYIAHYRRNP